MPGGHIPAYLRLVQEEPSQDKINHDMNLYKYFI